MTNLLRTSVILVAAFSAQVCWAAQVGFYDFSGVLSNHFTRVPPLFGDGATLIQSMGELVFHNASTTKRMEALQYRSFEPRADQDWKVCVDVSIPLAYDSSPPPLTDSAWIEMAVAVIYVDTNADEHVFLNALGVDHYTNGVVSRGFAPAELLNRQKVPHDSGDMSNTNETANLCISYNRVAHTMTAIGNGNELLTIPTTNWNLGQEDTFNIWIYGHSDNQPISPDNPMRLDNFSYFMDAGCLGGDDFNDDMKDPSRWGEDITDADTPSLALETNGRLIFTGTSHLFRPWICSYGGYLKDWEVAADLNLGEIALTLNDSHAEVFLGVFNRGDTNARYGVPGDHMVTGLDIYRDNGGSIERSFSCYLRTNWVEIPWAGTHLTEARHARFRIGFTAVDKTLTAWYDDGGAANGYNWTVLRSAQIDQQDCDWHMDENGAFQVVLGYSCSGFTVDASHEIWADNFTVSNGFFTRPFLDITRMEGVPVLILWAELGRQYAIEYAPFLAASNNWQTLSTMLMTNNPHTHIDSSSAGLERRFYRAKLLQ